MKIANLPYYVKFTFLAGDTAFSTADINMVSHIKNAKTRERVNSLSVGDRIVFAPDETVYRITVVSVNHLFEDTKDMLLGVDLEDAPSMQGSEKEWLLKLTFRMEKE